MCETSTNISQYYALHKTSLIVIITGGDVHRKEVLLQKKPRRKTFQNQVFLLKPIKLLCHESNAKLTFPSFVCGFCSGGIPPQFSGALKTKRKLRENRD